MRFTSELIFVTGKTFEKDGKRYHVALFADVNGKPWEGDWEEVFIGENVYGQMKSASFGKKVKCKFRVNRGKLFLEGAQIL